MGRELDAELAHVLGRVQLGVAEVLVHRQGQLKVLL